VDLAGAAIFFASGLAVALLNIHLARYPVDLAVYREAGRVVAHGGNPYAPSFGRHLRVPLPFTYPPFGALVAVPLALLPADPALVAWTAVSLVCAGALVLLAFRAAAPRAGRYAGVAVGIAGAVLLWTVPLSQTISFGQVNLPLALGCLLDCLWTSKRRGVLVGIATAWKLTPGLFIVYFAATRQWAAAVRAAAVTVACELLAAAVMPGASRQYWLHIFFNTKRPGDPAYFTNQSVLGALTRLGLPAWLWPVLALALIAYGLWRAAEAHRQGQEVAAVALVGLTILLVSPISWQHHAVWIVLVFGVLAAWASSPVQWAAIGVVLVAFLTSAPTAGSSLEARHSVPFLASLLENFSVLAYLVLLVGLPIPRARPGTPQPLAPEVTSGTRT
jgi:alpha-1,2-mannosyltransferase